MATGNYSYWKNCLTMIRAGTGITVDNSDPKKPIINATGGGGGGGIESVVAGDNVKVDDTDPLNPIINAGDGLPKVILWTAYGDYRDVISNVEYNDTGRTLRWDDAVGFKLSGTFTQKYIPYCIAGTDNSTVVYTKITEVTIGFNIQDNGHGRVFSISELSQEENPHTFKIEIYE